MRQRRRESGNPVGSQPPAVDLHGGQGGAGRRQREAGDCEYRSQPPHSRIIVPGHSADKGALGMPPLTWTPPEEIPSIVDETRQEVMGSGLAMTHERKTWPRSL